MDEQTAVRELLRRAADLVGEVAAPDVDRLTGSGRPSVRRGRRRRVLLPALAAASVVVLVAVLAVALRGSKPSTPAALPTSPVTGPIAVPSTEITPLPVVTAAQLSAYRWSTLPRAPIAPRSGAAVVWTGTRLLVWGGDPTTSAKQQVPAADDGAAYDPASRTWSTIPAAPIAGRTSPAYAWTGSRLFVFGGYTTSGRDSAGDGALYDPASRTWQRLPDPPGMTDGWNQAFAVGSTVILLGAEHPGELGGPSRGFTIAAAAYDIPTNTWRRLTPLQVPHDHPILNAQAVLLGDQGQLVVQSYWSRMQGTATDFSIASGTDAYALSLADGIWRPSPVVPDKGTASGQPVWTGSTVILPAQGLYCGTCKGPAPSNQTGTAVDPDTGVRVRMPHDVVDTGWSDYVWTGGALLGVGDHAAAWDPQSNSWTPLAGPPLVVSAVNAVAVWTGHALLVWGQLGDRGIPSATGGLEFAAP